jgi:hypothetical protein
MNILTRLYDKNNICITNAETVAFSNSIYQALVNDAKIETIKCGLINFNDVDDMNKVFDILCKISNNNMRKDICDWYQFSAHFSIEKNNFAQLKSFLYNFFMGNNIKTDTIEDLCNIVY